MKKRLLKFFRRLPDLIDACNELADFADIWRYGMDVAESRRNYREARDIYCEAQDMWGLVRQLEKKFQSFMEVTLRMQKHETVRLLDLDVNSWETNDPHAAGSVETYQAEEIRFNMIVPRDWFVRSRTKLTPEEIEQFCGYLSAGLSCKIKETLFHPSEPKPKTKP